MEIIKGVHLHFIQSEKFKTNKIKVRFSAPMSEKTIAGRVLTASMLETSNALYPTSQAFREKLANLYGANYSTSLSRRGLVHYLDINLSFVRDQFLSRKNMLADEILDFLKASLFFPLSNGQAFDTKTFEIEKRNVLTDLEAEIENHFYHAHRELNNLFYDLPEMRIPRVATIELVEKETAETSFAAFQQMLNQDQIDFFFIGDFNEIAVREKIQEFQFSEREQPLQLSYQQNYSNITREKLEQRDVHQSIVELAYHFSSQYGDRSHLPLIVLNGLLGGFAHSKLFVNVREKESLAYTISSSFDIFSGLMRIYAGIDRANRTKTIALINRQILDLKRGHFTDEELEQTKNMLKNSILLAQDRQNTLIERAYMSSVLGKKFLSLEAWLKALENVSKADLIEAVQQLKLQAIYFMEGK
ncbi:Antilisterial bacteriocin subtilosin biosynthesis protein AlbE [Streptococcus cristatus]|uniref:Antilisterial bacteriocin subtilosin biosynthesis protein AlbE n=1 Tax=Streptococcus cristatus TaxID=45634 RepID=A0A3R9M3Z3_STRCR|nr:pitrilysin family protein [Streptococcus cristatus]RSJ80740.1 Antilisterial bacteriocin subtilosin biosynthesis protein AlbE [Streptococcus cristatus]RSJ82140.1 Antilisterial bacteriocin subtilosin biosynthesis protein AlbE [Streptococcus cristatus]RSJ87728.1 Antilisterial bacteriocin subtilosin biosynthesis protein AlbE [Streptococcus cristatus]RSJ88194.1 Antilisterial bacteriocin subtilosin biosynthesis protein AlbE [Streptococcus cristatus]